MTNDNNSSETELDTQKSDVRIRLFHDRKRKMLIGLVVYAFVLGFIFANAEEDPARDFLFGLPFLVVGNWWCNVDAQQRSTKIGRLMRVGLALIFAVAFPIYLLRSRGFAGFLAMLLALLYVAIIWGVMVLGGLLAGGRL